MYTKLLVRNIKNTTGEFPLGNTTILRGPNESGKTAVLEAIRLAVTGRAEIGGNGKQMSELVCGSSASAIAIHAKGSSSWKCKVGSSVSCEHDVATDTQGGMPVSVDEFWALPSSASFALLAGNELCGVMGSIDKVKAELKAQEAIANQASIAIPDMYDGAPIGDVKAELDALNVELHCNTEATKKHAAVSASLEKDTDKVKALKDALGANSAAIQLLTKEAVKAGVFHANLERLAGVAKEASASEPKLVAWGRDKGLGMKALCEHFISSVVEACEWASQRPGAVLEIVHGYQRLAEVLKELPLPRNEMKIPDMEFEEQAELKKMTRGNPIAQELKAAADNLANAKRDLENEKKREVVIQRDIATLEHSLSLASAVHATPLPQEVLEAILDRKVVLAVQAQKFEAWDRYGEQNGARVVAIAKASMEIDALDERLISLNRERDAIVLSILSPIEGGANALLSRAGLPNVKLDVTATAKTASLDIRTGGVAVKALAKSRRLMYGICLLSAIQQKSDALSPVLLAQCAEMDIASFKRCVDALNVPRRGNVVLEHWADVTQDGVVDVNLTKLELALTA